MKKGRVELRLQRKVDDKVQCLACPRKCIIPEGFKGLCKSKINVDGKIYEVNYGFVSSVALDPIEKKPFFNFWPGSWAYSIGTVGCNLKCEHCQNWQISQADPEKFSWLIPLSPEDAVKQAKELEARSIAYTYNEPTIVSIEWVLDTAKLAKQEGILNLSVTNGYWSEESFDLLKNYIDAANVDVKAFTDRFYRDVAKAPSIKPVLETVERLKDEKKHVELTYLIIPTLNDREEEIRAFSKWVFDKLGPDTPVHFSRYYPAYRMKIHSTPVATIRRARDIAVEEGLRYVYSGNVPGDPGENTYCPSCKKPVIIRYGFDIEECNLTEDNKCKFCGEKIAIEGRCSSGRKRWPSLVI